MFMYIKNSNTGQTQAHVTDILCLYEIYFICIYFCIYIIFFVLYFSFSILHPCFFSLHISFLFFMTAFLFFIFYFLFLKFTLRKVRNRVRKPKYFYPLQKLSILREIQVRYFYFSLLSKIQGQIHEKLIMYGKPKT